MVMKHNDIFDLLKEMRKTKDSLKLFLYMKDLFNMKISEYKNDADMFIFLTTEAIPFFYNEEKREIYIPQLHSYLDKLIFIYPYIDFELNRFNIQTSWMISELSRFKESINLMMISYSIRRDSDEQYQKLRDVTTVLLSNYSFLL